MSQVSQENFIQLHFGHGDNIDKESLDEINKWLAQADTTINIDADVTADGVTLKFFKGE